MASIPAITDLLQRHVIHPLLRPNKSIQVFHNKNPLNDDITNEAITTSLHPQISQ
jgi:hypothetical protein